MFSTSRRYHDSCGGYYKYIGGGGGGCSVHHGDIMSTIRVKYISGRDFTLS